MNEDQLVLALISSYKSRGVDLTRILDDPLFSKLPAITKIEAIQSHAKDIHDSVDGSFRGPDYGRVGFNALMGGLSGAALAYRMTPGLLHEIPLMDSSSPLSLKNRLIAGGVIGSAVGAMAGSVKAMGDVADRRALKKELAIAVESPTPENAIGVLSSQHARSGGRTLRDAILNRIADTISNEGDTALPMVIRQGHIKEVVPRNHAYLMGQQAELQKAQREYAAAVEAQNARKSLLY